MVVQTVEMLSQKIIETAMIYLVFEKGIFYNWMWPSFFIEVNNNIPINKLVGFIVSRMPKIRRQNLDYSEYITPTGVIVHAPTPGVPRQNIIIDSTNRNVKISASYLQWNYEYDIHLPVSIYPKIEQVTYNDGILIIEFRRNYNEINHEALT
ncbi:Hsp20/alpha crystallin family protein [uncultured Methanomethylovorans sp.]|uniref:Hsp20/alpha crystallin family protein n=1 Tax=uncultured Methanomethylovorans sp. TaxID=183759 RepID=UPI002AA5F1AD|nr:Hsp20/alpha crystallin family protein [uncultured Methanomethylovorans sp.]